MQLTRRAFLAVLTSLASVGRFATGVAHSADSRLKVYYNDDTTDLVTLASPYHKFREDVGDRDIDASIDEAVEAGIDVYVNEPGTGWVPFWKSSVYPADEHFRWIAETYKVPINGLLKYMVDGGDVVAAALKHCRARGVPMLASFRLNDLHSITFSGKPLDYARQHMSDPAIPGSLRSLPIEMSRVHAEHPEWRFDAGSPKPVDQLWDWSHPEAVAHKLALCTELVEKYDVDGLELDFMRFPRFFGAGVPAGERTKIMTGFIRSVRAALDSRRKGRELALRVPPKLGAFAPLGLDLGSLRGAGVSRLNLSHHTFTSQDVDFNQIRRAAGGLRLTLELAQAKQVLNAPRPQKGDNDRLVLAAPADLLTTALLAQAKGFEGVSLFNFAYYRHEASKSPTFEPASEPPFAVIRSMKDPARAALPVQSWFLTTTFSQGFERLTQLPAPVLPQRPATVRMQIVAPRSGWGKEALLRFAAGRQPDEAGGDDLAVTFNGQPLSDKAEATALGLPENIDFPVQAYRVPVNLLVSGDNTVTFTTRGQPCRVMLCELLVASK